MEQKRGSQIERERESKCTEWHLDVASYLSSKSVGGDGHRGWEEMEVKTEIRKM